MVNIKMYQHHLSKKDWLNGLEPQQNSGEKPGSQIWNMLTMGLFVEPLSSLARHFVFFTLGPFEVSHHRVHHVSRIYPSLPGEYLLRFGGLDGMFFGSSHTTLRCNSQRLSFLCVAWMCSKCLEKVPKIFSQMVVKSMVMIYHGIESAQKST